MSRSASPTSPGTAALVAAAGQGLRLGRGPKAFIRLAGLTLIERAVVALTEVVDEIVVAVGPEERERAAALVPRARVIAGGSTRQETVFALLRETAAGLVLIHDAARPFLPPEVAERVLTAAREGGAATAARAIADTLIDARTGHPVDRDALRAVQTPQGFRRELILDAHVAAERERRAGTDDASLVTSRGGEIRLVEGSAWLFKVTTEADLTLAEALAPLWDRELRRRPAADGHER